MWGAGVAATNRKAVGMVRSLRDLQDAFHDAGTARERDWVRQELRDLGFPGLAATIRTVADGGVDARDEPSTDVRPDEH